MLQDFFCIAWKGDDWDGNKSGGGKWQPCPKELINAPKVCSALYQPTQCSYGFLASQQPCVLLKHVAVRAWDWQCCSLWCAD
jgi:hypothetical protein